MQAFYTCFLKFCLALNSYEYNKDIKEAESWVEMILLLCV